MKILTKLLIFIGCFLFAITIGLTAAILPTGVEARLMLAMITAFMLILAWGFRRESATFPEKFVTYLSIFVLVMSIVWPQYVFFSAGGLPRVNPFTLSTAMGFITILVMLVHYKSFSNRFFSLLIEIKPLALLFVAWLVWRGICNLFSKSPISTNLDFLREILFVYSLVIYGFVICQRKNGIELLGRIIVIATVFVGLAGVIEALESRNRFVVFASRGETGDVADAIATIVAEKIRGGAFRVQSVFVHPILFGQYLGAAAPIIFVSIFLDRSRLWRFMAVIALPLIVVGILKSGSRSGVMAILVSSAIMLAMYWTQLVSISKRLRPFAVMAVPLVFIVLIVAYGVAQQLASGQSRIEANSSMVRTIQLNAGLNAISESPIVGFGQGAGVLIAGVKNTFNTWTMDIYYLTVLLDSGWVGLFLFFSMVVTLITMSFRYVVKNSYKNFHYVSAYSAAAISVIITLAAVSMQQNIMFFLISACVLAAAKLESK